MNLRFQLQQLIYIQAFRCYLVQSTYLSFTNTPSNLLHSQCHTVVIAAEEVLREEVEVQDLKLMRIVWDPCALS